MKREADVASDHHLHIAKLKLKLKRNWIGHRSQRPRNDTTVLLKGTTKEQELKSVLLNKFQVLEELLEETINEKRHDRHSQSHSLHTCKEVLGPRKQHYKECISAETLKKIQEKKNPVHPSIILQQSCE